MKKILKIILSLVMLITITVFIVGCGNDEPVGEVPTPTPEIVATPEPTPTPTPEPEIIDEEEIEEEPEIVLESYFIQISGEVLSVDEYMTTLEIMTNDGNVSIVINDDTFIFYGVSGDYEVQVFDLRLVVASGFIFKFTTVNGESEDREMMGEGTLDDINFEVESPHEINVGDIIDVWYTRNMPMNDTIDATVIGVNLHEELFAYYQIREHGMTTFIIPNSSFVVDRFTYQNGYLTSYDEAFLFEMDDFLHVVHSYTALALAGGAPLVLVGDILMMGDPKNLILFYSDTIDYVVVLP